MTGVLVAGLLAGYGIAVPVGAIAALLVDYGARRPFRVAAAAAMGVATADGLYALAAVLGGAAAARLIEPVAPAMRLLAGLLLLALAVQTVATALRRHHAPATAAAPGPDGGAATAPRAFWLFLGLTVLNPATIVYFGALVLGRQAESGAGAGTGPGPTELLFALAAFAASASWQLLVAAGGNLVGRLLTGRRGRLVTALVSAGVVALLAGRLLLAG
ncbi:LysE family transporter [Allostreptomyces psammosilenae]|uniref:Arginine exporter protein ArgO n=1 Tax=Allostreptomyces psammosilenae TaxID=1892865 RepID=A0A853A884_9ACTN|nr:LysE family transporter [Allostreptomyces psammosilenae]NYI06861.1 arginine exporter protein ArgO [Allostreptomyces psammosilenae]